MNNNEYEVRQQLQRNRNLANAKDGSVTALMMAAKTTNLEIVECLLRYNAFVDARDSTRMNSFLYAVANGASIEVVQLFLRKGYSGTRWSITEDKEGALSLAAEGGHLRLVEYFLDTELNDHLASKNIKRATLNACDNIDVVSCLHRNTQGENNKNLVLLTASDHTTNDHVKRYVSKQIDLVEKDLAWKEARSLWLIRVHGNKEGASQQLQSHPLAAIDNDCFKLVCSFLIPTKGLFFKNADDWDDDYNSDLRLGRLRLFF